MGSKSSYVSFTPCFICSSTSSHYIAGLSLNKATVFFCQPLDALGHLFLFALLTGKFILKVYSDVGQFQTVWLDLCLNRDVLPAAAAEHQRLILLCVREACCVCCHRSTKRCSCFISCPTLGGIKSSRAQTQHGLERKPPMDYPLCALQRGWWGGENGLVFAETSWQRRGLRGTRNQDSLLLCVSLCIFLIFFIFSHFPVCLVLFLLVFPRARARQKCLQNCCAAPWLWSCMSTLWAPISATMTGTWVNEWHPNARCCIH